MEKHIKDLFKEEYIDLAGKLYGFERSTVESMDGFENLIYSYMIGDQKYVLRISHHDHQTYENILAELEFVNYLYENGAQVVTPVQSLNGKLAEELESGFTASCFLFAEGRHATKEDVTPEMLQEYGRVIATFHKLAPDFEPEYRRYAWDEDVLYSSVHKYIPEESKGLIDQMMVMIDRLNQLPKTKEGYGMMHTDVHMGNFFIHDGKITVFDFDDSCYKWFISDIAIFLFYKIWFGYEEDTIDFLMTNFMKGYNEVYDLDEFWFKHFDEFLKFRRLVMCLVLYRSFDQENPPEFVTKFFERHLEATLHDRPMITLDFTKYKRAE